MPLGRIVAEPRRASGAVRRRARRRAADPRGDDRARLRARAIPTVLGRARGAAEVPHARRSAPLAARAAAHRVGAGAVQADRADPADRRRRTSPRCAPRCRARRSSCRPRPSSICSTACGSARWSRRWSGSPRSSCCCSVRYRSPKKVVIALAPALLACVATVGALVAMGTSLTILHVMSLLLVVSLGVDFGIFFVDTTATSRRGCPDHGQHPHGVDHDDLVVRAARPEP